MTVGTALLVTTTPAAASTQDTAARQATTTEPPTVLVGIAGLRWTDVDAHTTPTLWRMIGRGAVASIPGGTGGGCARDAWTTLSAGRELPAAGFTTDDPTAGATTDPATVPEQDEGADGQPDTATEPVCAPMPAISTMPGESPGPATVLDWPTPTTEATPGTVPLDGRPGALGAALAEAGTCTTAIGPGAAIMLADTTGHVDRYAPRLDGLSSTDLTACDVVVVDAGSLPDAVTERREAREDLDDDLALLRDLLPRGSRILVAGIADLASSRPELQVVADWRSPGQVPHWLTSDSTRRRQGVAQLLDLSKTVAEAGGADSKELGGAPLVDGEVRRMGVARTVGNLSYLGVLAQAIDTMTPVLVGTMSLALLLVLGGAFLARRAAIRRGDPPGAGPHARVITTAVLVLIAVAPVAATLAALSRWWVQPAPTPVLTTTLALAAAVVAVVAWWISRLLPRSPLALAAALSGLTWLVFTADGLTGTVLQQGSILGSSPELGARFYGFNNMNGAVYVAAALMLAGSVASLLPRWRLVVVVAIGVVTTVVDGLPQFGADFGGVFALVPAFAVLGLLMARVRITWRRALAVVGATALVVVLVVIVDWLAPGATTHVGAFAERVIEGQGMEVIGRKAAGAWATIANPVGALALLAVLAAGYAVLRPRRCGLPMVAVAYDRVPLLRPVVVSLVVAAFVGSALNDSGVIIAVMFLLVAAGTLTASLLVSAPAGAGVSSTDHAAPAGARSRPPRMAPTLVAASGGLLIVLLLAAEVLTSAALRPATETATAGEQSAVTRDDALADGTGVVVVGTTGVSWDDVAADRTPALSAMLADGAAAGGVSQPTGTASRCAVGGWLALSAGQLATVTTTRAEDGSWACPTPTPVVTGDGARVDGWDDLVRLQRGSSYQATLGALGEQLRPATCATAVGSGAALALARPDGTVGRYRSLDQALAPDSDAFDCPVTLVDAGDATTPRVSPDLPAAERAALRAAERAERLTTVDATVDAVLAAAPSGTAVVVVDLARTPATRPVLGVALARPGADGPDRARYLTSSATHTDGIARALDVPPTLLGAAGITVAEPLQDTPLAYGSLRPVEAGATATTLAELTSRDLIRREAYVYVVDVPLYAGLVLAGLCLLVGRVRRIAPHWRARLATWARGAALFLASVSTSVFLVSLTGWWRFDRPGLVLAGAVVLGAAAVAGVAALAPRRPLWLAPGIVAGITYVVLTVDGLIGTPLNRTSPLGAAPTFGARFYGFGNPTFSVYTVAALILSAALAQWLVRRGRRWWAVGVVSVLAVLTMVVVVWPTLGADLGGGLVIVPGFAVVAIAASGARVTWSRVLAVGAVGVGAVAAIGVLDWLRPPEDRSHLGRFVGQVVQGEAFGTLVRKAGYALRSVLGGLPVWLTLVVLVATALVLFLPRRFTPGWWARAEEQWPLLRSATLGLWIVVAAGSLVNDFGVRIAMVALIPAVPLYTAIGLSVLGVSPGRGPVEDDRR